MAEADRVVGAKEKIQVRSGLCRVLTRSQQERSDDSEKPRLRRELTLKVVGW